MHPGDADSRGIREGQMVVVENDGGAVQCRARVSDRVPVGVVWSPRQFEDADGRPQNAITMATPQTIGGGSTFNSTIVRVARLP